MPLSRRNFLKGIGATLGASVLLHHIPIVEKLSAPIEEGEPLPPEAVLVDDNTWRVRYTAHRAEAVTGVLFKGQGIEYYHPIQPTVNLWAADSLDVNLHLALDGVRISKGLFDRVEVVTTPVT